MRAGTSLRSWEDDALRLRVRAVRDVAARSDAQMVLYWMIAARRPSHNHALDRAIAWARALDKPLVVLEALRCGYPWASDRLHRFVLDGMADNHAAFERAGVLHHAYVEPEPGAGSGLLRALAERACVIITDDYPTFFLPRMIAAAGKKIDTRLEAIDSTGLLPMAAATKDFAAAVHFRWLLQRELPRHLEHGPAARPFAGLELRSLRALDGDVSRRWPRASARLLRGDPSALAALPIDHEVAVAPMHGGFVAARKALRSFVDRRLARYDEDARHPDRNGTSRLSPYLHFGHVSTHEILAKVASREGWSPDRIASKPNGARHGWWNMSPAAESFLDELVTWRELAYCGCHRDPGYARWESLPAWARTTLDRHAKDEREHVYRFAELERGRTHDALWNAAQAQLVRAGWFPNMLRMLWGKKILEWSASPREALRTMIRIMDRWSLDGRDPNSYAGYGWTLGRYDKPWPERPVFGKVRAMSSAATRRKVEVARYLERWAPRD